MFDILDSNLDLGNLGGLSNSRSGSMKKINKKDNAPTPKQSLILDKSSKMDFDSILDKMASKQSKFFKEIGSSSPPISNRTHNDLLDHHFQKSNQSRQITSRTNAHAQRERFSLRHEIQHNQSNIENHGISQQFGRTQHTIVNPSTVGQSFVSSRQMKPPIKRKESVPYIQSFNFGSSVGNPIPQQDPTIANYSQQNQDIRVNSRSNRRRSSIDARSEMNQDIFPLTKTQNNYVGSQNHHFDAVKEDSFMNIHKSESCVLQESNKIADHNNFFSAKEKLQLKSENLKAAEHQLKTETSQKPQQKTVDSKLIVEEYEKQISLIKNNYKNQIEYLQQSLDRQIAENKTLRETFMLETTKLIEQQRSRSNRIHQEEINRMKDIFSWEKKRIEETYKMEIESLKSSFEFANKNHEYFKGQKGSNNRQSLQFLEYQLKSKQAMVENKLRSIELRQMELQTKQNQLSNRRKKEQDKFREEEKRLMDMQLELKKQILQNKKSISHEKQQLASDLASLESQYMKKNEQLELQRRELQIQKNVVEEQKIELRRINAQVMTRHKVDLQEIQRQKQKLKQLQLDLVKKIRVVEMKAKQMTYQCNNHQDFSSIKKQSNWVNQHQVFSRVPSQSAQKKLNNSKSMASFNKTKQRFYALQHNSKSKLNISIKQNKKIDLSGYMTRIQNQNRFN